MTVENSELYQEIARALIDAARKDQLLPRQLPTAPELAESEKALAAGCTAYLEPAVAPARFVQQVEQHLSGNQEPPAYQQPEVLSDDSDIEPV